MVASHSAQVADAIHSPPCPSRASGPRPCVGNGTLMICHRFPVQCSSAPPAFGSLLLKSETATQAPCAPLGTTQEPKMVAPFGVMLAGNGIGFCQRPVQRTSATGLGGVGWWTRPTTQMFRGPGNAASYGVTGAETGLQFRPLKCSAYTLGAFWGPMIVPNAQASEWLNTQADVTRRPSGSRNARHRCPLRSSAKLCSVSAGGTVALFTNVQEYEADRAATAVPNESWLRPENALGGESSRQVRPSQCAISRPGLSHWNRNASPVVQASRAPVAVTDQAPMDSQAPKYFTTRQAGDALACAPTAPAAGNAAPMRSIKPVTANARRILTIRMISAPSGAVNYHGGQTAIRVAVGCDKSAGPYARGPGDEPHRVQGQGRYRHDRLRPLASGTEVQHRHIKVRVLGNRGIGRHPQAAVPVLRQRPELEYLDRKRDVLPVVSVPAQQQLPAWLSRARGVNRDEHRS